MKKFSSSELIKLVASGNEKKIYKCRYWRDRVRSDIIARDNNECQWCKLNGKVTKNNLVVHHIEELKDNPARAYDYDNLVAICRDCHEKHHDRFQEEHKKNKKFINEEKW